MENNKKENIDYGHAVVSHTFQEDAPPPPPPAGYASPFNTLQEWLLTFCNAQPPVKPIEEYQFLLMESKTGYIVSMLGWATYEVEKKTTAHRIEWKPPHLFFPLPAESYSHLLLQQARERFVTEVKEFTKTSAFQQSFLAKSVLIQTNYGDVIWQK